MIAYDQSTEPKTATATVSIYIERNNFAPEFEENFYSFNVSTTTPPGTLLGPVSARDGDLDVLLNSDVSSV